jgi:hypothetical protein
MQPVSIPSPVAVHSTKNNYPDKCVIFFEDRVFQDPILDDTNAACSSQPRISNMLLLFRSKEAKSIRLVWHNVHKIFCEIQ